MKTSMSSVFIFVPPLAAWVWGQPVDDRFRTHACERPHTRWVVPLISGHQRPAAAGDFRPPDHLRTGARHHAHSNWPGPGPPRTTNKVTGGVVITVDPRSIGPGDAEGTLPWAARALQPHHDALIVIRTCRPSRHSSGTLHPIPTLRLESASVVAVGPGPRIAGGTRTSIVFRGFV